MTNVLTMSPTTTVDPIGALLQAEAAALPMELVFELRDGLEKLQSGEAAKAVTVLSRVVERAPQCSEPRVCLGLAHALTNNIYPAIDELEKAGELAPNNFAAHYTLAQLNFKLRIPKKGYEAAERALACVQTLEQRKMLTQLLREERARERSGIARPSFNKMFSKPMLFLAGSGLAALLAALLIHVR